MYVRAEIMFRFALNMAVLLLDSRRDEPQPENCAVRSGASRMSTAPDERATPPGRVTVTQTVTM